MDVQTLGRHAELSCATAFLDRLWDGPEIMSLHGEAGIGKSTLWRDVMTAAANGGCRVVTTRPGAIEEQLAYSGLTDLFTVVEDELLRTLPAPQHRALAAALLRADDWGQPADVRAVSAGAAGVLRALALDSPVVIGIDDVQWLDAATFRVVESVVRRLGAERVGVVVTERGPVLPARSSQLRAAASSDRFTGLGLCGLSAPELRTLLDKQTDEPLSLHALRRIVEVSDGNPFYAVELARARPGSAGDVPLTPHLRALVETRLAALSDTTRLALLAAGAEQAATLDRVATGAGTTMDVVLQWLERGVEAGILTISQTGHVCFSHPLYAAGAYALAPPSLRRVVHRRLSAGAASVESTARHLARGQVEPDQKLADMLDDAARHAAARGAPDAAAELAVHACRLTPPLRLDELARRQVNEARFRYHAGELGQARLLIEHVLERAPGAHHDESVKADALCLAGEIAYRQGSFNDALVLFRQADQSGARHPGVACRVALHLAYGSANTGAFEEAPAYARRALALSEKADDVALRAESLAATVIADYLVGLGLDETRLSEALRLEDPFHQIALALRPLYIAGDLMLFEGRLSEAVAMLTTCRQAAEDRAEEGDVSVVVSDLAWAESCRGRLRDAQRYADEALTLARRLGSPGAESFAQAQLAVAHACQGHSASAHHHADCAVRLADRTGSANVGLWTRWGLGILALSLDDFAAAHAVLEPLAADAERRGLVEPVRAMYLADEIEALIGVGDLERARRLVDLLEACAGRLDRGWALTGALRARALLEQARGNLEEASQVAALARKYADGIEHRLEVARTLLVSGVIERRRRHRGVARPMLAAALDIFEQSGAEAWARRTRDEIGRLGTSGAPAPGLTPTERRIADLSAHGLANREVATKLNISPKTVEANLTRIYRKLGIHSRAQLGALVAQEPGITAWDPPGGAEGA